MSKRSLLRFTPRHDFFSLDAGALNLTFQIFTSSIHTVLGIKKLNQRFIGCAKPSER